MRLRTIALSWLALSSLVIAACSTNEQACTDRGLTPGSEGYASCMAQRQRAQQDAQDRIRNSQSGNSTWSSSIHPPICVGLTCY
jgi:hypothetical protein